MSKQTEVLTEILVSYDAAMPDIIDMARTHLGEDERDLLVSWASWTGNALSAVRQLAYRVEEGKPIAVPCRLCGDIMSMFEVVRDETICAECKEGEEEIGLMNSTITPSA